MNLRKLAKGKPCMVRSQDCNGDPETTVLAHVRLSGISGMGLKSPDLLGAWCCSSCHTYVDAFHDSVTKAIFANGVYRTIAKLIEEGHIKW